MANAIIPLIVTTSLITQRPNSLLFDYYNICYNQKCLDALYKNPEPDHITSNIGKEKWPFNREKPGPGSQAGPSC